MLLLLPVIHTVHIVHTYFSPVFNVTASKVLLVSVFAMFLFIWMRATSQNVITVCVFT